MPIPERIRQESAAAEAEMQRLAAEAANAPRVVPPGSPTNPEPPAPRDLDTLAPGDVPHPNAVTDAGNEGNEGNEPISGEAYAALKQQFETLQGIHNRDRQKLSQTEGRLETLERVMQAQLAARTNDPAPAAPAAPARREPARLVKQEEIDEFGADLIDVVRRTAREEFVPVIEDVLHQVQSLTTTVANLNHTLGQTAQVAATTAEDRFNAQMDNLVKGADGTPDWQQINNDQNFIDWSQEVGQDSDEPRINVLRRAYQRKDAQKCAGFFNAYKREKGLPTGNDAPGTPSAPPSAPANPAANLISPAPVAPANPTANRGAKKTYKLSDIENAYADYTKGKYKGREAEFKAMTAEFDKATLEGRVVK